MLFGDIGDGLDWLNKEISGQKSRNKAKSRCEYGKSWLEMSLSGMKILIKNYELKVESDENSI